MSIVQKAARLIPLPLGLSFIGGGAYMALQGFAAKAKVRDALVAEQITTSEEASIPRALVSNVETAEAQSEIIRVHSLRETDGRTFAQIPRGDPLRDYYLHAVTLRTALGLSVMGLRVSDLVVGMGAFMAATGGAFILVASAIGREPPSDRD